MATPEQVGGRCEGSHGGGLDDGDAKATEQVRDKSDDKVGKMLGERIQRKLKKWDGRHSTWSDWKFQLKVAIGATEERILEIMEEAEKGEEEATIKHIQDKGEKFQDADKWAKALFEAIVLNVEGDALTFMKGVSDQNGFEG